jgi:hypothetical protein
MSRDNKLAPMRAQAGLDRDEYFSRPGATAAGWRGGPHLVTKNGRREAWRQACRSGNCDE